MKGMNLIAPLFIICQVVWAQTTPCDFFGLEKPGISPQDFNPEILNMEGSFIFNAVFNASCDEFYFTKIDAKENIYCSKKVNGVWQSPEMTSFSIERFHDADPFFSADGKRIYFVSSRPTDDSDTQYDYNIWYAERKGDGWGQPVILPHPINTDYEEYFFSISNKGNAYFASNRSGGVGSFDIYQVKIAEDGSMSDPVNVGPPLNTSAYEFDPHISLDENYMVFSINNKDGTSDLYFSYKNMEGAWTRSISLGNKFNTAGTDFAPSLSPDNQYLIYTNNGKLKWVSVDILNTLK